jgi:hypothetical protein
MLFATIHCGPILLPSLGVLEPVEHLQTLQEGTAYGGVGLLISSSQNLPSTHLGEYAALNGPWAIFFMAEVREPLVRVHKGLCKLRLARRSHDG